MVKGKVYIRRYTTSLMIAVNLFVAFGAGLFAFLSPCVLPLIPAFLAYMAGTTVSEAQVQSSARLKIFLNSAFFCIGFALVFAVIGALLNSVLLGISYDLRLWLGRIGGIVIIFFGLFLTGLIKLPFLEQEYKLHAKKTKYQYLTSFIFGATFAAGWTPCVGVFLGTILTLAVTNPASAFPLLLSFALGLTLPFLLAGIFYAEAVTWIQKAHRFVQYFKVVSGVILILLGILVFTNNLSRIASFEALTLWFQSLK